MWQPDLNGRTGPRYRAIADALADAVAGGELQPGTRLPTHRHLAEALGVTVGTVTRAYTEAERRGLVEATVGRGTFVCAATEPPSPKETAFTARLRASRSDAPDPGGAATVDLSTNLPVPGLVADALAQTAAALPGPERWAELGGYQPAAGRAEHREAGAAWLAATGLPVDAERVVAVPGTQPGLTLALNALCTPGDAVLVEALTYPGVRAAAHALGLRPVPVAMDGDGLCPDALAEAARRSGARVVFTMPTLHNPTNATMGERRRRDILAVARDHDLTVIEDAIYAFLDPEAPAHLAAMDRERVVHLTGLSKAVSPGVRVGYVVPPDALHARLIAALRASLLMTSTLTLEWARVALDTDIAGNAARAQRDAAARRQDLARARLPADALSTHPHSFHAWLKLPAAWSTAAFAQQAEARGVVVSPGDAFAVGDDPRAVRLCLCAPEHEDALVRALDTLAELLATPPASVGPVV
ncbi:transcriptional regulator, GntR family [Limimonas halophila]|uniref:Transcriptional regulator, GntR family n=1 Tax=Limimonas halophila TaxID=1082479 RepID=A0A1G7PVR0_9PROT|nr:PLP-dependent aminotransferase family protein [Limimonas halophila]SDF90283.1 transcriptional regulator, GntR family [Limimonas halophila]